MATATTPWLFPKKILGLYNGVISPEQQYLSFVDFVHVSDKQPLPECKMFSPSVCFGVYYFLCMLRKFY